MGEKIVLLRAKTSNFHRYSHALITGLGVGSFATMLFLMQTDKGLLLILFLSFCSGTLQAFLWYALYAYEFEVTMDSLWKKREFGYSFHKESIKILKIGYISHRDRYITVHYLDKDKKKRKDVFAMSFAQKEELKTNCHTHGIEFIEAR